MKQKKNNPIDGIFTVWEDYDISRGLIPPKSKVKNTKVMNTNIKHGYFSCTLGVELEDGRYHEIDVESAVRTYKWNK